MQIIENWTDLVGEIEGYEEAPDFVTVRLKVAKAAPVEGYENLLAETPGQTINIKVQPELAKKSQLKAGALLTCRVRRAGSNRYFAHPEHCSIKSA
jgi:hypothetical protein